MAVGSFGAQMGFSQEVVQEFQISSANFDLSTGTTDAGAVNVVTRSGGNDLSMAPPSTSSATTRCLLIPLLAATPPILTLFSNGGSLVCACWGPIRHDRVFLRQLGAE